MKAPANTPSNDGDFKLPSVGVHVAVYETWAYLGDQPKSWGTDTWMAPECWMRWAMMDEFTDEGKPLTVHTFPYTFSMGQKANLRKVIEASFGKQFASDREAGDFEMRKLLGCACQINVTHEPHKTRTNDDGSPQIFPKITSWMPLPAGTPKPDTSNLELIYYDPENQTQFDKLPQWIRKKINNQGKQQKEYSPIGGQEPPQEDFSDSIPF